MRPVVVLLGLLGLAVNLRAGLAAYPPLLETVRADTGAPAWLAGSVQAGAVLAMAVGSFGGAAIGARAGREWALAGAVGLVASGSLVRVVPHLAALIAGSVVVGVGVGVAGVLLTGVVKDRLADRAGAVTGGYVVAMLVGATAASALAVPLAVALGGWSLSLAVWAVPAVVAAAAWLPVARAADRPVPAARAAGGPVPAARAAGRPVPAARQAERPVPAARAAERPVRAAGATATSSVPWRDGFARLAACYLAGASLMVYGWMTWLAPYYEGRGWSPAAAGLLLAAWSLAQIPAALLIPAWAERRRTYPFRSAVTLACAVVGTLGVLLVPEPPLVGPWMWVVLIGIGAGAGFPLGLAIIAWRTPDAAASAAVSGVGLGVGYTVAGVGPLLMGVLVDLTGGFVAAVGVLLAGGAAQGWAIRRLAATPPPEPGASAGRTRETARGR